MLFVLLIFFTFGGATSVDKCARQEGISWWKQEMPSFEELDEGIANLKRYNNNVDYIITHSCGERARIAPVLSRWADIPKIRCFRISRKPLTINIGISDTIIWTAG